MLRSGPALTRRAPRLRSGTPASLTEAPLRAGAALMAALAPVDAVWIDDLFIDGVSLESYGLQERLECGLLPADQISGPVHFEGPQLLSSGHHGCQDSAAVGLGIAGQIDEHSRVAADLEGSDFLVELLGSKGLQTD